jgi:hypothetical protein
MCNDAVAFMSMRNTFLPKIVILFLLNHIELCFYVV